MIRQVPAADLPSHIVDVLLRTYLHSVGEGQTREDLDNISIHPMDVARHREELIRLQLGYQGPDFFRLRERGYEIAEGIVKDADDKNVPDKGAKWAQWGQNVSSRLASKQTCIMMRAVKDDGKPYRNGYLNLRVVPTGDKLTLLSDKRGYCRVPRDLKDKRIFLESGGSPTGTLVKSGSKILVSEIDNSKANE